jgi:hypothetical protein
MTPGTETYNGWTNRETWLTALWLGNDEASYWDIRRLAAAAHDEDEDAVDLAPRIESYVSELAELTCPGVMEGASFVVDLFSTALARVDWEEIARGELESLDES